MRVFGTTRMHTWGVHTCVHDCTHFLVPLFPAPGNEKSLRIYTATKPHSVLTMVSLVRAEDPGLQAVVLCYSRERAAW